MSTKPSIWPSGRFGVPQITPFTYRDGHTHMELIEALREHLVERLHPSLVSTVNSLAEQMETEYGKALDQYVNGVEEFQRIHDRFMSDVNAHLVALNDSAVSDLVDDSTSLLHRVLHRVYADRHSLYQVAVNAHEFGAVSGSVDSTQTIQAAIDYAHQHKISRVIVTGEHNIQAHDPTQEIGQIGALLGAGGISLYSNMTLDLSQATLRVIPNDHGSYNVIRIEDCHNTVVLGGKLIGDRDHNSTRTGEWGHGIQLANSHNILIEDTTITDMFGDGIYIFASTSVTGDYCEDVSIRRVRCDNNRRQGVSIIGGKNIVFEQCVFTNTHGTAPSAGADIEPNAEVAACEDIVFRDCQFTNNHGFGIIVTDQNLEAGQIRNITIDNCRISGNHDHDPKRDHELKILGHIHNVTVINTHIISPPQKIGPASIQAINATFANNVITGRLILRSPDNDTLAVHSVYGNVMDDNIVYRGLFDAKIWGNTITTRHSVANQTINLVDGSSIALFDNTFHGDHRPFNNGANSTIDVTIRGNTIHGENDYPISIRNNGSTTIIDNTFYGDRGIVDIARSNNVVISNNIFLDGELGYFGDDVTNCVVHSNTPQAGLARYPDNSNNVWISDTPGVWWHDGSFVGS